MRKIILIFFIFSIFLNYLKSGDVDSKNILNIKDFIRFHYLQTYPSLEINSISLFVRNDFDIQNIKIDALNLSSLKNREGHIIINYHNSQYKETIKYSIDAKINVYAANVNIKANSNISESDIAPLRVNFISFNSPPASLKMILDSRAKSYIQASSIILKDKLGKKILVFKDSVVRIYASENGVSISQNAKALQNGSSGDRIRVQNLNTKKILDAIVVDENSVMIK